MGPLAFFGRGPRAVHRRPGIMAPGWVRPMWLERQLDPHSSSFVPQGQLSGIHNLVDRSWTGIGNIGSPYRAVVDARGLVTPVAGGWSVDWWVGAEDRWHFPSREPAVRQALVGTSPVIETIVRVPGGDAVCRAYSVVGPVGMGDIAIMEVENRSAVPFAVGFAIRPYNHSGPAAIGRIDLGDDHIVRVDGAPALYLPRAPSASAASTFAGGDVAASLPGGLASPPMGSVRCPDGLAQAIFVFGLSHTSSIRMAIPIASPRRPSAPPEALTLPSARDVARAWDVQTRRGTRVTLPPGRLADVFAANRKHLLLAFTGDDVVAGPAAVAPPSVPETALMLQALDSLGFTAEALDVIKATMAGTSAGDDFEIAEDDPAAYGAAVAAIAAHWRLTRDASLPTAVGARVASAGRFIARRRRRSRRTRRTPDAESQGLLPARGDSGPVYADDLWAWRGLIDGAELLQAAGDDEGAVALAAEGEALARDLQRSFDAVEARTGTPAIPAGPGRPTDSGVGDGLLACALGLLRPDDRRITATLETVRAGAGAGPGVIDCAGHTGLSPSLTLQVAGVEALRGDRRALDRLRWVVEVASNTSSWPESVHPVHRGGTAGDGQDLRVAARFVLLVRSLLVQERPEGGLSLFPMLPAEWDGQGLEVHDALTTYGRLSFAMRWHGTRPALLWDLDPHAGLGPVTLRAPALDPDWSTTEPKGEALLAERDVEAITAPRSFS